MDYKIVAFFSFSIYIVGTIAAIRYQKINKAYYPFLFCTWVACINELLSFVFVKYHQNNLVNGNIYVLVESILIIYLFKKLKTFRKSKFLFYSIISGLLVCWITENLILSHITNYAVYFRIVYSFIIVLISISSINEIIAGSKKRNATFLLCIAFIIYFTFKVFVYAFWISGLSAGFLRELFTIMIYINLLTNLIYAVAILWMPRRLEFSLP